MDKRINPGSFVRIKSSDGVYEGILMERAGLAAKDHVVLKLESGYNIGISLDKIIGMEELSKKTETDEVYAPKDYEPSAKLPRVSVLATGGTIASRVDYLTGGVHSAFTAEELISAVPELSEIANIDAGQIFNKFSENIVPADWKTIAEETHRKIKENVSGVVITHGTDTMHYTSAALSFMLKTPVPVVLTGAQRSSDRGSSDAARNLLDAATVAAEGDLAGVYVVMHGEMSDSFALIHPGTRARKFHTSRRDAFRTVNAGPAGKVADGRIEYFGDKVNPRGSVDAGIDTCMDEMVHLLKYHPGLKPAVIDALVDSGFNGIVLEGTGLGHVGDGLYESIKNAIGSGVSVAMTSQTVYGRVNMNVYSTGRVLLDMGVIPCEDMLSETAYVKLMWVLGHTRDAGRVYDMMRTNYAGEISEGTVIE